MERLKRAVSLVLCMVMVLGLLPMNVFAEGNNTHYLMFATDRHANNSFISSVLTQMENDGATIEYVGLGGDMVNNQDTYNTKDILDNEINAGLSTDLTYEQVDFTKGSHDSGATDTTGYEMFHDASEQLYVGEDYYVYGVIQGDMENTSSAQTAAAAFETWAGETATDTSKVIIVLSHLPLHKKRNDNVGATYWHDALNAVADSDGDGTVDRDVIFFHGHNHTSETTNYFYNVGDAITLQGTSSSSSESGTTMYTYATAGYLNANSEATLVTITDTTYALTRYNSSGNTTELTTVTRVADSGDSGSTETTTPTEGGDDTTTGTKEVYVLVDTMTVGKDYLIANGNSGTVTLLGQSSGSAATTTATVVTEGDYTYIETADSGYVWNATAHPNSSYSSYPRLINAEAYAMYVSSGSLAFSNSLTSTSGAIYTRYWTYSDGQLACVSTNSSSTTYYLTYSDGFSATSSSPSNIYIYEKQTIVTEVVLSSIAVTTAPTTTSYNVGDTFSSDGLVVTATYNNGSTAEVTGYTLSDVDMTTSGTKTVTVTYTEGDVTKTATFDVVVNDVISETATPTGLTISGAKTAYTLGEPFTTDGMVVTATYDDNGTTKTAEVTDYTVSEVDMTTEGTKTVTVSYTYNGTTVTESFDITVTEAPSNEVTQGGTVTTTKTVYVLTSSITSGTSYLIVNGNSAGSYYALANNSGSVAATGVTVVVDDTIGTYIELTDATDELWTVGSGYTFLNGGYYLGYTTSGSNWNQSYSFGLSTTSRNWSYSNNRLSTSVSSWNSTTYYLRYNNGWTWTSQSGASGRSVYFYVPTEIKTTVDTTVVYTMRAEDVKQVVNTENADTMSTTLDYCLQGNGEDLTTLPSGGSYSFTVMSDENGIISGDIASDGTVNFTGNIGTAKVKVAYTWTQDGETYTVYKNITVEATEPYYSLDLHKAVYTFTEVSITEFAADTTYYVKNDDGTYTVATEYVEGITYYTAAASVGDEITETVAIKGVEQGDTYSAWAVIKYYDGTTEDGEDLGDVDDTLIEWTSSDETIATVDAATGIITFTGKEGTVNITATYLNGNKPSDTITLSVSASNYTVPSDGTVDFPEYPNEGAIRYDKTATAVGNFSETGIAQVELSMTGVPYTTGSEIDVVIMLDMTGSMSATAMTAAEESAIAFAEQIVKNDDGTYNNNRIAILAFNSGSSSPYTYWSLGTVSSDTEWSNLCTAVRAASDDQVSGGTPYDDALSKCREILQAAKTDGTGNNRQQFCVFVSDGGPTSYEYITNYDEVKAGTATAYTTSTASATGGANQSDSNFATIATYTHEYYSTLMKDDGVTMYSVLTGLTAADYPNCTTIMENIASDSSKAYVVEDGSDTSAITNAFTAIAVDIKQAATNITVEDKITDEYTMIFDLPKGTKDITGLDSQEFYIEFVKYTLDANHERTDDVTSITKLYLKNTDGVYSAASDASGTAYDAPVFTQTTIGEKGSLYYWTTDDTYAGKAAVTYTNSDDTYYFIPYGKEANEDGTAPTGWYNMTSGGYASGTVDSTTNMSTDLVIATPYFVYNAANRMLYWTVDKLDTTEYALRYFLYLDNSATEVGEDAETDPGSYPTNDHAYITYTNFKGHDCRQVFPIPQLTWSGAQVSYVFYLVNAAGQPINKSGQVVDFANATFVTDIYTENTVWNKGEDGKITADSKLGIDWLAANLLPADYKVYDEKAEYKLHVYGSHDDTSIFDYFIISGNDAATISSSLNSRLDGVNTSAETVSLTTTKVYNTKAGTKISGYGTYTSEATDQYEGEIVLDNIDFYNTTVAFAVVWQPKLVEDVVVVDYGLDVIINVVQNDLLQNTVSGIGVGNSAYGDIAMNTGVSTDAKLGTAALTIDGNTISIENENQVRFHQGDMEFKNYVKFYYESPVKFYEDSEQKTGYMYSSVTVIPATTIYYEDSFLTLDSYTLDSEGNGTKDAVSKWVQEGETLTGSDAVQDTDRPGNKSMLGNDANNLYGYDSHYTNCSEFSLGSAQKITVDATTSGVATFSFYGTGFDVVSMTSNDTGTIIVKIEGKAADNGVDYLDYLLVDTYYGYARVAKTDENGAVVTDENGDTVYEWVVVENDPNALYQVPIMKVEDLAYGKYTVTITASYVADYDHKSEGTTETEDGTETVYSSYDFYLDAIRIYDPANDGASDGTSDTTIEDAYKADGEYLPAYYELRNWLIKADSFNALSALTESKDADGNTIYVDAADNVYATNTVDGIVFIDGVVSDGNSTGAGPTSSVSDYSNYGPNNELYLAPGQAVAFNLNAGAEAPEGYVVESVQIALKSVGGIAAAKMWDAQSSTVNDVSARKLSTATDLYYDITDLDNKTVVIMNAGSNVSANEESEIVDNSDATAILSITNVKVTYKLQTAGDTESGTDAQSVQDELQMASFGAIGGVQTYAVAAVSETEEAGDTAQTAAPFTVSVTSVEQAIASLTVTEETEPETSEPETSEPETSEPETSEPETTEPETTEPETTEPETSEPETSEPETSEPETSEPETTEPETSEPEETEPDEDSGSSVWDLIGWLIGLIGKIFG